MSDGELFVYSDSRPMDEEGVQEWLARDSQVKFTTPDQTFYLAVVWNETQRVIGWVGLTIAPPLRQQANLNLVIDRQHQRKGFGTEAIGAVLGFCFGGIATQDSIENRAKKIEKECYTETDIELIIFGEKQL